MRPEIGQLINGKYRLSRLLGDGGMGTVFQAQHEKLRASVALKFLHAELAKKSHLVERFLQEARASAQIKNEHVVRVSDVDQTPDGAAFIVLEYLEGRTLQALYEDYHQSGKRLSYAEALDYAMQMVDGLEAAHDAGVVHRDLKPDNVMITTSPRGDTVLKLLDFGIAKLKVTGELGELEPGLTRPGVIMGTPEYMAPEQAYSADGVDSRADVFSLGVIVFEMLAGRRPVAGEDARALAQAYVAGQTAKLGDFVPNVAPELEAAVHKAMAPLAKDRFATARAFREAIEPFVASALPKSQGASRREGSARQPPGGGSEPVMPPVALSAVSGTVDDRADASGPASARAPVAKTWPPEGEGNATKAMSPLLESSLNPGTVPGGDMTAMMPGYGADAPQPPVARPSVRKKKRGGLSTGVIVGIAAGLGLVVTFVVFLANRASSSDDDKPVRNAVTAPPAAASTPAPLQVPSGPAPQPQPQPPPPQPQTPMPPPPGPAPQHPRPNPSGPSAPPSAPTAPGLPPGMPNIPGLPTAPGLPTTPPSAPSGPTPPPGLPGMPPLPTGLPSFPSPFPPPPG